jgi:hypothetical protein
MILTPQQLWKDYDRKTLPLAASFLPGGACVGGSYRYVYFNGEKTSDGVARVFAKFYEPDLSPATAARLKTAVVVFDHPTRTVDAFDAGEYLSRGFAVLVVDYAGADGDKERFTLYPKSLSYANYPQADLEGLHDSDPTGSCWYVWTTAALRAVTFLENAGYQNRFGIGIGYGGPHVWKLCYFEDTLRAGAVFFSGPAADNASLSHKAAIGAPAYASLIKAPVYLQITSNEQNGSLDFMSALYEQAALNSPAGAHLSISERANRVVDPDRADNAARWFELILDGKKLPPAPVVSPKNSDARLYCSVVTPNPEQIAAVALYVAHAQKNSAFRNWRAEPLQTVGEGEYLAQIAVPTPKEPVYAFVNVRYQNGICVSSAVSSVVPAALGVSAATLNFKRLIYDSTLGLSDWMVLYNPGGKSVRLSLEKGPFGLEGIYSPSGLLSTFRLADPQYRGKSDSVLQLTLYSGAAQTVSFHITVGERKYTAKRELAAAEAWSKQSFSPNDFKSQTGGLSDWDGVLTFEIESASKLLVNSALWV